VNVTRADRHRLEAIVPDRSRPTSFGPLKKAAAPLRSHTAHAIEACGEEMAGAVRGSAHDYKCRGTITVFATLTILDSPSVATCGVIPTRRSFASSTRTDPGGESDPRHRRQLCDPHASEGALTAGPAPKLDVQFHPTSASRLHAVEGFYTKQTCVTSSLRVVDMGYSAD
jgi:hypothetical protein